MFLLDDQQTSRGQCEVVGAATVTAPGKNVKIKYIYFGTYCTAQINRDLAIATVMNARTPSKLCAIRVHRPPTTTYPSLCPERFEAQLFLYIKQGLNIKQGLSATTVCLVSTPSDVSAEVRVPRVFETVYLSSEVE